MSNKTRLAVLVSGGGTNLQSIIDACQANEINAEVALVVSTRKKAYALERAKKAFIPSVVISPKKYSNKEDFSKAILKELKSQNVDLVILAGFMSILSSEFISCYHNKIMNTHPSLLPSFGGKGCYGIHVHEKVIDYGVKVTGATIMFVNEGVDTGPIILQESVAVKEQDTPESLSKRVLALEHSLYKRAISLFASNRLVVEGRRVKILPNREGK